MNSTEILLSVCMITFNHEKYIAQAIDGVLMQETNFEYEVIIANDCSSDNTDSIVKEYINNHLKGKIIKYFRHPKNIGMMLNFIFALQQCSGKYIALCDGDDYWTDPLKLQKQYDFLEQHAEYSLCFHNAIIVNEIDKTSQPFAIYSKSEFNSKDLLQKWLIPTSSVFFKNVLTKQLPQFIIEATHGDLALFMFLAEFGKIHCIDEVMSVYRIHSAGVTQSIFKGIHHNLKHVRQIELMHEYFGKKYESQLNKRAANYLVVTAYLQSKEGNTYASKQSLHKAFKLYKFSIIRQTKYVIGTFYYWLKNR